MIENGSIVATFEHSILSVRFLENAKIELKDVQEVYDYANMWAKGQPYCVLFEATAHFEVDENAVDYISNNPNNSHILAKAYVVGTDEQDRKAKAHLRFDHPQLKPYVFKNHEAARAFLDDVVKKNFAK